jgi:hypothetical protein
MFGFQKDTSLVNVLGGYVKLLLTMHDSVFVDEDTEKPNVTRCMAAIQQEE